MALLADGSGDANSNLVQGNGTNSLTFTMPKNVALNVSSVLATVNNAAGGDTTATMVIKDQSGEVIATKRQLEVIPAGDTGTANWSLRDDDNGGTGTAAGFIKFDFDNVGDWLTIRTTGQVAPAISNGIVLEASEAIVLDSDTEVVIDAGSDMSFDSGGQTSINATGDLIVTTDDDARITAASGDITLDSGQGMFLDANVAINVTTALLDIDSSGSIHVEANDIDYTVATDEQHTVTGDILLNAAQINVDGELAQHGGNVGFFGKAPVSQQATPVTLANVIALLQAYGLSA